MGKRKQGESPARKTAKKTRLNERNARGRARARARTPTPATTEPDNSSSTAGPSRKHRATVVDEAEEDARLQDTEVIELSSESSSESEPEDEEAQLNRLKKEWSAPVYAFFEPEPAIVHVNGRRAHVFQCTKPSCKKTVSRYLDTKDAKSTGNLRKHVKACWGEDTIAAADACSNADAARPQIETLGRTGKITDAFKRLVSSDRITYSTMQHTRTETRAELVRWVCESQRPFSIVKDRAFVSLMKTGRPEYWIPSPSTVSRDVRQVFLKCRERIGKMLQDYEGKINFAQDAWTAPNHRAYVAFTAHLHYQGKPLSFLLDILEVPESHTGETLAVTLQGVLDAFGIMEKILALVGDNASNNDKMVEELALLIASFPGEPNQVRCFLHVLSLIAKRMVREFDAKTGGNNANEDEVLRGLAEGLGEIRLDDLEDLEGEGDEDDIDIDAWLREQDDLSDEEREDLREAIYPIKLLLAKLRKLAYAMINSSTKLLPAWKSLLKVMKLAIRIMPRDVATRWNSTFLMLNFAFEYRDAIDRFTGDRENDVRKFELSEKEWELLSQLRDVLKIFYDATSYFSRGRTPALPTVIPAMDKLDEYLTNYSLDRTLDPAIRASAQLSKRVLNKYYSKTDLSETYRIAMILHPRYKAAYFKKANWGQDWIKTAIDITRAEFIRSYHGSDAPDVHAANDGQSVTSASRSHNIFDKLDVFTAPMESNIDELDVYLRAPCENISDDDVLEWWFSRRAQYPRLSIMALSYLTIPATSVDVERVFSRGRLLLSHVRNRLSAENTRAILCVGEWSRLGLVHDEDVLAVARLPVVSGEDNLEDNWDTMLKVPTWFR